MTVIFLKTGTTSWTVPADCTSAQVEIIGAGGNGLLGTSGSRDGGGSGGYSRLNSFSLTPSASITVQIAAGGSAQQTWFNSTSTVLANAGGNGAGTGPGVGAAVGVGDVTTAGVTGGTATGSGGAGGAAASGPDGIGGSAPGAGSLSSVGGDVAGATAGNGTGGTAGSGTTGAPGGNGTQKATWTQTSDSEVAGPGGGGGGSRSGIAGNGGGYGAGGGGSGLTAGSGSDGLIVITYTPTGGAVTGTMAAVESGSDVLAATGTVLVSGTLAVSESGSDTLSATGSVLVSGSMASVESGADNFAGLGTISDPAITGVMAAQEDGGDTFAGTGEVAGSGFRVTSSGTSYSHKTLSRVAREAKQAGSKRKAVLVKGIAGVIGNPPQANRAVQQAISERPAEFVINAPELADLAIRASEILALWDEEEAELLLLTAV